ncbi:OsmC family protein [Haladaptatus salinisoli]|uniref:OsmC family protein n=1 Tax=Haladaptatus salinisoli TaxID=2884876 RepID=UPI001D09FB29|nr:OsmC family protein [Haladaptatus salinisoli]
MTVEQREAVRYGVDGETFGEFVEYAKANPDDVQFELSATGRWEGRAFHTLSKVGPYALGGAEIDRGTRDYSFLWGAHKEVEEAMGFVDPDDRPEVIEGALAALSGCLNHVISLRLMAEGIDVEELETRVRVPWDPFVALDLAEVETEDGTPRDQFGDLRVEIAVGGENVDDDTLERIRRAARRSAVFNLVTLAHPCEPVVSKKGA